MLKKVSVYSVSKYIELGLHALVLLHFATTVGPAEYGETAASLLAITYSAFIVLGMNGAYVKYYSLAKDNVDRVNLSGFCLISNAGAASLAFFFVFFFVKQDYVLSVAIICAFNLLKGAEQSILRASLNVNYLAILNTLFSFLFASIYAYSYLLLENMDNHSFFRSWSISLVVTVVLGIYMLFYKGLIAQIFTKNFAVFFKSNFLKLFSNGILLALLTFSSIFFISSDRIIMIWLSLDSEIVGRYQFADSVTNIFYMGSSALLYLLTPFYTRRLNNREISPDQFIKTGVLVGAAWVLTLLIFLVMAYFGVSHFAPGYIEGFKTVMLLGVLKYTLLFIFIPSTLYMTFHKEKLLLKIYFYVIPLTFLAQLVAIKSRNVDVEVIMPLIALVGVFGVLVISTYRKNFISDDPGLQKIS